jgi:acetyl-CoA acetyltransferase
MLQLEDYGFCKKGEGGHYVSDGAIMLGGKRPNNTSGAISVRATRPDG